MNTHTSVYKWKIPRGCAECISIWYEEAVQRKSRICVSGKAGHTCAGELMEWNHWNWTSSQFSHNIFIHEFLECNEYCSICESHLELTQASRRGARNSEKSNKLQHTKYDVYAQKLRIVSTIINSLKAAWDTYRVAG